MTDDHTPHEGTPAPVPASGPARLVWMRQDGTQVEFVLEAAALVGRDEEADVHITEALVSRQHARLEPRDGGWVVVDLGSTNLTRVNGDIVRRPLELSDGDEVQFARARCRFHLGAPAVAGPASWESPDQAGGSGPGSGRASR